MQNQTRWRGTLHQDMHLADFPLSRRFPLRALSFACLLVIPASYDTQILELQLRSLNWPASECVFVNITNLDTIEKMSKGVELDEWVLVLLKHEAQPNVRM